MHYDDVTLELSELGLRNEGGRRLGSFTVRVLQSPAGEMAPDQAVSVEYADGDLHASLAKLDRRELEGESLIALGRTLAGLLLPSASPAKTASVRELFARSLAKAGPDRGTRLRLRLPHELSVIPWEYVYVERAGGVGMDGFIALDPRIAIVRHEVLASPLVHPLITGDIKVVAALASAEGLPPLDLDAELKFLTSALGSLDGLDLQTCSPATLEKLQPLLPAAGVFHFAGHGDFTRRMGARPGTYTGVGYLAFDDKPVDAAQLGINLRGNGVRLAVLGGCHTGRRDGVSVWSGIAPALVKAEVPAVVANQYTILDKCAIAFTRHFYQGLVGGLPIERAVTAGRIAAYNADRSGRDWGVPVLYLRAGNGQLFEGAADRNTRERARKSAQADVQVRAAEVKADGVLVGADVGRMIDGKFAVAVSVPGTVTGELVGSQLESFEGGRLDVHVDVGDVGDGGSVTGFTAKTLGAGPESSPRKAAEPIGNTNVGAGPVTGGQVIGTQVNERRGDTVHGDQVNVTGGRGVLNTGLRGDNMQIGSVTIYQGSNAPGSPATNADPHQPLTQEALRLDVAIPKSAVVDEPFDVVVAVRQPDAPALAVDDLEQIVSAHGSIFRSEEMKLVTYRIELVGAGFQVSPPSYLLKLEPRENSQLITFQVVGSKSGRRSLLVNAYQEDGVLAAQTRLRIEVVVAVLPRG